MTTSFSQFIATMVLLTCTLLGFADSSLTASGKSLSMIMAAPDWIGNPAQVPRFTDDGKSIIYRQKRIGEQFNDFFQVEVDDYTAAKPTIAEFQFDEQIDDRRKNLAVINRDGNLFLADFDTGERTALTLSAAKDLSGRFMSDEERIMFSRDGQQYSVDIDTGLVSQLTNIKVGTDAAKKPDYSFLSSQRLITAHAEAHRRKEVRNEREKQRARTNELGHLQPVYLGDERRLIWNVTSTDGKYSIVVTTCLLYTSDAADE